MRTVWLCELHHGLVHDRAMVGHRRLTALGMARVRAEGRHLGGDVPYGYALEKDGFVYLVEEPEEQRAIANVLRLRASTMTVRAIAATMAETGFKMRNGNPFSAGLVQRILAKRGAADTPEV